MSGERPGSGSVPQPATSDDELSAMLLGRASRVTAADAREVLAAARTEIAGPGAVGAAGSEAGERGGRTFGVRPVRIDRPVGGRGRPARMPWRLAVLSVAAVVAVAVLGSRLGLRPKVPDVGASPTASDASSQPDEAPSLAPLRVLASEGLETGVRDGTLAGRTVLVEGRLSFTAVLCPAAINGTSTCLPFRLDGAPDLGIGLGSFAFDDVLAGVERHPVASIIAVRVAGGSAELVGWVVDGVGAPLLAAELAKEDAALPRGDIVLVGGWLLPKPADPPCIRLALCEAWPRLTDARPFLGGVPAYDTPGVNVGVDATLRLDDPAEYMVGRFLVESLGSRESLLPPYRVLATLDGQVQQLEQPVTAIDRSPTPSEVAGDDHMTAEDFARALRLGELDGRIVVVEGRMRLAAGRCRSTSEDCTWLKLEGLDDIFIDKGDLAVDEAAAAIRRHSNVERIALRASDGGAHLIGWITAGASTPVDVAALRAGDLPLDPGDVAVVAGWLLGAPASPSCSATFETCAMWPTLSPSEPIPGNELYGDTGMAVMVAESLGLPPAPATIRGPFVVAAWRAPTLGEPGFEVVDRFVEVATVDVPPPASMTPAPAVTPTPTPASPISPPAGG